MSTPATTRAAIAAAAFANLRAAVGEGRGEVRYIPFPESLRGRQGG